MLLAGLQNLKSKRDLRDPSSTTPFLVLRQEHIGIGVSELGKVLIITGGSGGLSKIRLKIQGHPFVDIAGDEDAGTADQEAFIIADGAIVLVDRYFWVSDVSVT
jgi:hypothetical protein